MKLYQPVTEHMQLDMRMNLKTKRVRLCGKMHAHRHVHAKPHLPFRPLALLASEVQMHW
jgi:hypothetical protein